MSRARKSDEIWAFDAALGRRIAMTRRALGIRQLDLAAKVNVSQQLLSLYETGTVSCPSPILARIAIVLGVSVTALMPKYK